jgi:apolipoprotein N-acyltransferase
MPVFAIRFLRTRHVVWGFILLVVVSYVTGVIAWWGVQPLPFPVNLALAALTTLLGSLPFLVDRLLASRLPGYAATLVFPLALTVYEFVSLATNPMGTWSALAYTQYGNLPLMQLASLTGLWGFAFLIGWFGSVVNWAWERAFDWPRIRRGAALYAGVLLLVLAYGSARLLFTPPHVGTVRVVTFNAVDLWARLDELTQDGEPDEAALRQMLADAHDRYFEWTIREARAGARVVLWSEAAGFVDERDEAALIARGKGVARQEDIYLAMPLFTLYQDPNRPAENKLLIVDPAGDIVLEHVKYGGNIFEGTLLGDGVLRTVETPYGTLSGVICWDADFPLAISQVGRNDTDILLVPSGDWLEIDPLHTRMAVFRAIENGTSLVRQVADGRSMAVDAYGRELAQVDHFTASERVLVAQVPTGGVLTLYPYTLDAVGWLSIVGLVIVVVWAVVRWRRAACATPPKPEEQAP